jgi:hypothetical protein
MRIQTVVSYALIVAVTTPLLAETSREAPQNLMPADAWRAFVEKLEPGAYIRIRLTDHTQVKGHFIPSTGDSVRIKPKTRIPVPLRDVQFIDIESIDRQKEGWSPGTKVLTGVAIGCGTILLAVAILAAAWD